MGRTVLIDADILAFQVATTQETTYEFNGQSVLHADLEKGCEEVEKAVEHIITKVDADQAALFLTGTNNFRKEVYGPYKENRKDVRRPMILGGLRGYMQENYRCFIEDNLEGDDLIGIHATMPHKGERVIYSADKDLKTVPGLHWEPDDGEIIEIDEASADRFFYEQILTGDPTDNYPGCPGVGPVAAATLLDGRKWWKKTTRILKSGPNKGKERVEWKLQNGANHPWSSILSAYRKVGLKEQDALTQARCARILRHGEYNFKTHEVNLWVPH